MAFEAVLTSAVSALCAGCICCAMTAERLRRNCFLMIVLPVIASAAGIGYLPLSYAAAAAVLTAILGISGAKFSEAVTAAFTAAASSFLILLFVNAMTAPTLEAYSYTLRNYFYYSGIYSGSILAAGAVLIVLMLALSRWLHPENGMADAVPLCIMSISLAAAAVMILHMLLGRLIEYNAKYFKLPMSYSMLTGGIAVLCCIFTCVFIRMLNKRLMLADRLAEAKEFYFILAAIILMIIFYCCENIILNNYTSFDEPEYKYMTTMLIVLMIITVLTAFTAVCSYILRTRAQQSRIEREIEITAMYRNEIKDMQQSIFDFRHDYMKLYSSMSSYIMNKEYDRLTEFFNRNIAPLKDEMFSMDEESAAIRFLEDKAVQGLIYSYIIKAKKSGVSLFIDIRENIPVLDVSVMDLNRILGIFLDNAIEQAQKKDKRVEFAALSEEDGAVFIISNTADGVDIEKMFRRGESTKGEGRGRGLSIARKLCASHDEMSMNTYAKNGAFVCELYINKSV